ncbi:MAG: TetR/AcrR family transcriptional regulator [Oscillospiraceae bacterium]
MAGYAKRHISTTLLNMMKERPIDEIKVSELIEASGVNRKTFYYHYHGMEDVLADIIIAETEKLPVGDATVENWEEKITLYLNCLLENGFFVRSLYMSSYSDYTRDFLKNILRTNMVPFVHNCLVFYEKEQGKSIDANEQDLNMMADFLTNGIWPIMDAWVRRNYPQPVEHMVALIDKLTDRNIFNMFERFYL